MKVLVFDLLVCGANLDHLKGGGPELPCRWRSGNFPGCDTANVAVPERISRPLGSSLRERRAVEGPRVRILLPPAASHTNSSIATAGNAELVLLCWERLQQPGEFCHRRDAVGLRLRGHRSCA